MTLCWDCENATGGCCWSEKLIPVNGWWAEEFNGGTYVVDCPLFKRDSYGGGQFRTYEEYMTLKGRIKR